MQFVSSLDAKPMQKVIEYRGYRISQEGLEFVAKPLTQDTTLFEMGSRSIDSMVDAIDDMWGHLDVMTNVSHAVNSPAWFQDWIENGSIGRVDLNVYQPVM
jgi:hypothetical protein